MVLDQLPADIIHHVLYYLHPEENLTLQCVSRRLQELSELPLVWKYYCRTSFKFWANLDHFNQLSSQPLAELGDHTWRNIYLDRRRKNKRASRLLNRIIQTKVGRLQNYQYMCDLGYDVKDYLLEVMTGTPDFYPDVLARR